MHRDKFLGFDPVENLVFVFFFEENQKKFSFFIQYSNDKELDSAKSILAVYCLFWDTGSSSQNLITMFNSDPSLKELGLKSNVEMAH